MPTAAAESDQGSAATDGVHVPTLDHEGGSEPETLNQGMVKSPSGQESSSSHVGIHECLSHVKRVFS